MFEITALTATPQIRAMLSAILIETVAHGGSVSFMHPLAPDAAHDFWDKALAAAARDERVVLGACCSTARPTSRIGAKSPS
jgi:hypothetical protein